MLDKVTVFFDSPTTVIAFVSAVIAFCAYKLQRKSLRKQNACIIAERYAREFLPRIRYIHKILELTGNKAISHKFRGFSAFTEKELTELLQNAESSLNDFQNKLATITEENLKQAFAFSGCSEVVASRHNALLTIAKEYVDDQHRNVRSSSLYKCILDMLNELEAVAVLLRYNIADEKLIYQSLHQTFLSEMQNWYFFISDQNRNDQDRYFGNLIWLYNTWNKRKTADEKSINNILTLRSKAKRL